DAFSFGLKKSLFNYMHGIGFELPLREWFDFEIPFTTVVPNFIENCLNPHPSFSTKPPSPTSKIIWLGSEALVEEMEEGTLLNLTFHSKIDSFEIALDLERGEWLLDALERLSPSHDKAQTFGKLKADFEEYFDDFEAFWNSEPMAILRENGLLVL
ncbi:MAG: radical SAM protein, partial [Bacteroidia bacterium]